MTYDNSKEGINQDWTHRQQGRMAVRLLNKADCVGMCEESESHIDVSSHVAIIDLRVFVPEVISVLSTFAKHDFKDQLDQIPFFCQLIGHQSPHSLPATVTYLDNYYSDEISLLPNFLKHLYMCQLGKNTL